MADHRETTTTSASGDEATSTAATRRRTRIVDRGTRAIARTRLEAGDDVHNTIELAPPFVLSA